jgi:hypothetical protein
MKTPRRGKPKQLPPAPTLIERTSAHTRFIEFPDVQGRAVEKIQMSTCTDHHAITIDFQDKTSLVLNIEPCFLVQPHLSNIEGGDEEIVQEWRAIRSS